MDNNTNVTTNTTSMFGTTEAPVITNNEPVIAASEVVGEATPEGKPQRQYDENGFVIETPNEDEGDIVFDEDPIVVDVPDIEIPEVPIIGTNTSVSTDSTTTEANIGTEQSGNITF